MDRRREKWRGGRRNITEGGVVGGLQDAPQDTPHFLHPDSDVTRSNLNLNPVRL